MANSKESTRDHFAKYLHSPMRADHLESLEEHLNSAASLSRALWIALSNEDCDGLEERSRVALLELAGVVADHASAAVCVFNMESCGVASK
jgi:hypothetical protein